MIISTGMANADEIGEAVDTARENGCDQIVLLHCVSSYPAPDEQSNVRTVPDLAERFGVVAGLSDHTAGSAVAVASIALGGCVVEKHFTLARADGGPDAAFSLEPDEFRSLVQDCKRAWRALGKPTYDLQGCERGNVAFRRSLYVVRDIAAGEDLTPDNVRSIRPGFGLPPKHLPKVLGRRACRDLKRGAPFNGTLWKPNEQASARQRPIRLAIRDHQQYRAAPGRGCPRHPVPRWRSGIDTIDTARLYGDSEAVIGRSSGEAEFRIVTKTQRFGQLGNASAVVQELQAAFASSLEALHRQSLYGLLVHHPSDLIGPLGRAIWSGLEELKALGQVQKIGVSVYEAEESRRDSQPLSGRDRAIAIQRAGRAARARRTIASTGRRRSRSARPLDFPARAVARRDRGIAGALRSVARCHRLARDGVQENGLTRLEGLLAMTMQRSEIARLVVGVTSSKNSAQSWEPRRKPAKRDR